MMDFRIPAMVQRVEITNLVPDGSFEDIANNWIVWLAEPIDTSQAKDGSQSLKLGGDALASTMTAISPIYGHKYYGREYIKTSGNLEAADCRFEMCGAIDGVEKAYVFGWNRGNFPEWTVNSGIVTIDHETGGSFGVRTFTVGGTVSAWVDSIVVIDLTEACGAGNEPSKEWCDANIPFFSGSYTLDIPLNSPVSALIAGLTIPEGVVKKITDASGVVLWSAETAVDAVYLRPSADISVGHSKYPADASNAYSLINEEVSDGASTHIYVDITSTSEASEATSKFAFTPSQPVKSGIVNEIKLVIYGATSYCSQSIYLFKCDVNGNDETSFYSLDPGGSILEYEATEAYFSNTSELASLISKVNEYLSANGSLPVLNITLYTQAYGSSSKNAGKISLTQIYLELTGEFVI